MKILHHPRHDTALREQSEPWVFDGSERMSDPKLGRILMLMLDAMYLHDGIGLAAPQVGLQRRLIIVDPVGERHQARIMFNPEIWWRSEETNTDVEGCLSVPGEHGLVERHNRVKVRYCNRTGLREELDTADDQLLARVIQHEIDHLDGVLFIDKVQLEP